MIIGSTKLTIKNQDKLNRFFEEAPKDFKRGYSRAFDISGREQEKYIKNRMLHDRKTGRLYKKYVGVNGRPLSTPKLHRASAPGEYPAVVTKKLYKSVGYEVRGFDILAIGMGTENMEYAKYLEFGTSKMEARSPIQQTAEEFGSKVREEISKQMNRVLKLNDMGPS